MTIDACTSTAAGAFRAATLVAAALFTLFAAVQYNDPDPVVWIAIYGLAAIASAAAGLRPRSSWLVPAIVGVVAALWSASLSTRILGAPMDIEQVFGTTRMINTAVEETREALGLLLVAAWMGVLTWRGLRQGRKTRG